MFSRSYRDESGRWGAGALRTVFALVVSLLLAWTGIAGATPAQAAGAEVVIEKSIVDPKAEYKKGDTVIFNLSVTCYSSTDPCYEVTVTDVLPANLTFVSQNAGPFKDDDGNTLPTAISFAQTGQSLKWIVGIPNDGSGDRNLKWFLDGQSFDIQIVTKVASLPGNGVSSIPNDATATISNGATDTDSVDVPLAQPTPAVFDWSLQKVRSDGTANPTVGQEVTYDVRFTRPSVAGGGAPLNDNGIDITSVALKDMLPPGATFVKATSDSPSLTGVYDAGSNTVTFPNAAVSSEQGNGGMYCGSPCISYFVAHITVKYEAANGFEADDTVINKASADPVYEDGSSHPTLTAEASVTLADAKPSTSTYKANSFSYAWPAPGQAISWDILGNNNGNVPLGEVIVTDDIPTGLDPSTLQVNTKHYLMPKNVSPKTATFEYFDGTDWVSLGSMGPGETKNLPATAKKVRMTATNVALREYFGFSLNAKVAADVAPGTVIKNCASTDGDAGLVSDICAQYTVETKPTARVYPQKTNNATTPNSLKPGDEFTWFLRWRTFSIDPISKATIVENLPAGFELVTEEAPCLDLGGFYSTPGDCAADATKPAYTVEPQADGTTKITFKDMTLPTFTPYNQDSQGSKEYWLHLRVRVKDGAPIKSYTNTFEVQYPDNELSCASQLSGGKCGAPNTVSVVASSAVGLQKWDKGTEPNVAQDTGKASAKCPDWNGYTKYPCVAQTLPEGEFSYRFKWANQGNVDRTNAIFYDILPHIGNTGVSEVLSDDPLGTEWTPVLTGPLTFLGDLSTATNSGYQVLYNKTFNPCRPEVTKSLPEVAWDSSCNNVWYTAAEIGSDWASVKSFKVIAFQDGAVWKPGERLVFELPMKAPADAQYSTITAGKADLSVAWNIAAQRSYAGGVRLASEPRKVGIIVPAPYVSIGDYVWYDANRNGKQDASELPAEGVKVTLKDKDGNVVGTTTTDADGYYWFQNLMEKTKYNLEFEKPAGYDWTSQDKGSDNAKDSDVDSAGKITFTSPTWISGKSHNLGGHDKADDPTLDAGLVLPATLVSVGDYVWWDADRDGLQDATEKPIAKAGVQLYKVNADGSTEFVDETVTDADGYYAFTGLVAEENYKIKFLPVAGAVLTTQNSGGVTTNSPTADVNDSDADPVTGTVPFKAEASGSNLGDPTKADNPGIDAGYIAYDLTIDKKLETTGTVYPRSEVTYSITPKNLGPVSAMGGWSVTDLLPAGLTLVEITGADLYYTCTKVDDHKGTCVTNSAAVLAPGAEGAKITVKAKVADDATGSLKNVAYVDKAPADVAELIPLIVPDLGKDTSNDDTNNDDEAVVELTVPLVSVGDFVWFDTDRDGQQDASEPKVAGVTVNLYKDGETTPWKTTTTDANGHYAFTDLVSLNKYTIEFKKPDGTTFTTQNSGGVTTNAPADATDSDAPADGKVPFTAEFIGDNSAVHGAEDNPGIDAGLIKYNLVIDKELAPGQNPIRLGQDVTYTIVPTNEGPVDALGGWSVVDLLPAGLTLKTITGEGYTCTKDSDVKGTCTNAAVLAAGASGKVITVVATVGEGISGSLKNVAYVAPSAADVPETVPLIVPGLDKDTSNKDTDNDDEAVISLKPLVSIGDYVWYDNDRDGVQDADEAPYKKMTVELWNADGTVKLATTQTSDTGYYAFGDLEASTDYRVKFIKAADESFTAQKSGSDAAVDSNPVVSTGVATVTTKATGKNLTDPTKADDPTIDAGIVKYNLRIAKSLVSSGPYYENGTATFEIDPWNDGPAKELAGWSVTDLLPEGLTAEDVSGEGYDCTINAAKTSFTCVADGELAAGEHGGKITVVAKIGNNFVGKLHNVAYVSPAPNGSVPESILLAIPTPQTRDGWGTDTTKTATDNDAQAELEVLPKVSIGDYVWFDTNRNGAQDEGEKPVNGVTVNLYDKDGKLVGSKVTGVDLDVDGYYFFDDLMPGEKYTVEFVKPANTVFTQQTAAGVDPAVDSNADVATGKFTFTAPAEGLNQTEPGMADDPTIDAGLVKLVSVGDYVWYDTDKDGVQDESELPVPGVTVNLIDAGKVIATTTTDADGFYFFTDLETTKAYTIEFVKPANTTFTKKDAGTGEDADAFDSDADPVTGKVNFTAPADGKNGHGQGEVDEDDPTIDAGLIRLVSVGDYVWFDTNRDGLQTEGEVVVPDVTVNLYDADGKLVATTKTDSAGYYAFKDLLAETKYTIEFVKPADTSFTTALTGDAAKDSNADLVTGKYSFTSPKSGSNLTTPKLADDPTIDAGLVKYNLKLTKTRTSEELLYRGETVTFQLIPSNDGPVDALAGWSVTDLLPSQLVLVSMSGVGYQCTANVCVSEAPLAAGASGNTITVVAKPGASFNGKIWNVAYVAPAAGDITETIVLGPLPTNLTDTAMTVTDNDSQDFVRVSRLTAAEAANDGDGDNLAFTGSNGTAAFLGTGLLLLAAGTGLVLARRRRSVN